MSFSKLKTALAGKSFEWIWGSANEVHHSTILWIMNSGANLWLPKQRWNIQQKASRMFKQHAFFCPVLLLAVWWMKCSFDFSLPSMCSSKFLKFFFYKNIFIFLCEFLELVWVAATYFVFHLPICMSQDMLSHYFCCLLYCKKYSAEWINRLLEDSMRNCLMFLLSFTRWCTSQFWAIGIE